MKPSKPEKPKDSQANESRKEIRQHATDNVELVEYLLELIGEISHHLPRSVYSCAAQAKDIKTIETRFRAEGLSFATKALPILSEGLFLYLETGKVSYPSFSIKADTGHPVFLQGLFRLAYGTTSYQVTAIRLLYQISVGFSKFRGPYPESVLRKQYSDFVQTDRDLDNIDWFSDVNFPILEQARFEINRLFKNSDINQQAKPRPGPGATNQPVAKHMRYRPHVLYTQINDVVDYMEFFNVHPYDVVHQTRFWLDLYRKQVKEPRSRYTTVPKKAGKGRGICLEENEVQFLQQGYRRALYQCIENHPLTAGKINFSDQSINALLALIASWTGQLATLDLSEASDRNARELVSWTFQDQEFHDALMALSTRWIDFPDLSGAASIRSFKFAPMGSALCFPIMSLLYWALIRSIIHLSTLSNTLKKDVYVYGDDIVVPLPAVDAVLTYLPRFGMKVNQNKSFYRSGFRESCGVHAYNGVDITPVYVKYIPVNNSISQLVSCIEVEAQFFKSGYLNVARRFRKSVEFQTGSLPIVSSRTSLLGFKRDGVFFPYGKGTPRERVDEWGNPTFKFRVVKAKGATHLAPPTDHECYLRTSLTNSSAKEIGGKPTEFKTQWQYLRSSQLTGVARLEIEGLSHTNYNNDLRSETDAAKEKYYENYPRLSLQERSSNEGRKNSFDITLFNIPYLREGGFFKPLPEHRYFSSYQGPRRVLPKSSWGRADKGHHVRNGALCHIY